MRSKASDTLDRSAVAAEIPAALPQVPAVVSATRRRWLRGAAGLALAAPIANLWAQAQAQAQQREGVQVGPRSRFASVVSAQDVERASADEYHRTLEAARQKNLLALPGHPQLVRLAYIAERLRPFAVMWNERARQWHWEVNLIGSPQVNAYCMPGGKIVFYWGILTKLQLSDDEVAMIMGHEMTHALREHAREQMGKRAATNGAIGVLSAIAGLGITGRQLANMGGQLLSLKYSRDDETEADLIGLELAARAGYDPRAALSLWRKMQAASQGAPPGFLSDHPSNPDRLSVLAANIPRVEGLYARSPKPDRFFGPPVKPRAK